MSTLSGEVKAIEIVIPDDNWQEAGVAEDPSSRLLCTFVINGMHYHVEAFATVMVDGVQLAAHNDCERSLDGMFEIGQPGGPFETMEIRGREYILTMTPYS